MLLRNAMKNGICRLYNRDEVDAMKPNMLDMRVECDAD